jgi:hypothetical protein
MPNSEVEAALDRLVAANATCGNGKCSSCAGYGGADNPRGNGCEEGHAADFATLRAELTTLTERAEKAERVVEAACRGCSHFDSGCAVQHADCPFRPFHAAILRGGKP